MGKTCAVLRAVTLNSWTDTRFVGRITLPFVPIQSSRAVPTDQAEIVREDQLGLQEHCIADRTAATRIGEGQGLFNPARLPMDFGT